MYNLLIEYQYLFMVVTVQFIIYLIISVCLRRNIADIIVVLIYAAFLSVPFGFVFDYLIGYQRTIFYYPNNSSLIFYIFNSLLSYGLALASAYLIPVNMKRLINTKIFYSGFISILFGVLLYAFSHLIIINSYMMPYINGIIILVVGEGFAICFGRFGPIFAIIKLNIKPFIILYIYSVLFGAAYEIANYFFPVWRWYNMTQYFDLRYELQIILLGYFVLFHSAYIVSKIAIKQET